MAMASKTWLHQTRAPTPYLSSWEQAPAHSVPPLASRRVLAPGPQLLVTSMATGIRTLPRRTPAPTTYRCCSVPVLLLPPHQPPQTRPPRHPLLQTHRP